MTSAGYVQHGLSYHRFEGAAPSISQCEVLLQINFRCPSTCYKFVKGCRGDNRAVCTCIQQDRQAGMTAYQDVQLSLRCPLSRGALSIAQPGQK